MAAILSREGWVNERITVKVQGKRQNVEKTSMCKSSLTAMIKKTMRVLSDTMSYVFIV